MSSAHGGSGRTGVLTGLALLAVALLLAIASPFAGPLLAAAVLAGALHPWCERLAGRLGRRRALAAALMTVAVALLVIAPIAALAVPVTREAADVVQYVRTTLDAEGIAGLLRDLPAPLEGLVRGLTRALPRHEAQLREMLGRESGAAAAAVSGALVATTNVVLRVALWSRSTSCFSTAQASSIG